MEIKDLKGTEILWKNIDRLQRDRNNWSNYTTIVFRLSNSSMSVRVKSLLFIPPTGRKRPSWNVKYSACWLGLQPVLTPIICPGSWWLESLPHENSCSCTSRPCWPKETSCFPSCSVISWTMELMMSTWPLYYQIIIMYFSQCNVQVVKFRCLVVQEWSNGLERRILRRIKSEIWYN